MFSLFTSRTRETSTRLMIVARAFQFTGVVSLSMGIAASIVIPLIGSPLRLYPWLFPGMLGIVVLKSASYFLIGQALARRQKWGAYLAGLTLGLPLVRQLVYPDLPGLSVSGTVFTTAALAAIVTVWGELGSVRDSELDSLVESREDTLPKRARGFGEPRALPDSQNIPATGDVLSIADEVTVGARVESRAK